MADTSSLDAIDKQIQFLYTCYRKWYDLGTETGISPIDALAEIDVLLEQRHDLATSLGELTNPLDVADVSEWGTGDAGTAA
jgi:hypothetical protein